jgi:hypothetical protein
MQAWWRARPSHDGLHACQPSPVRT